MRGKGKAMLSYFRGILRSSGVTTRRLISDTGDIVNIADVARQLSAAVDPFSQIQVAEYTPIVERKPLPGASTLRDKVLGAGTVTTEGGETVVNGSAGLTSIYTRDYGRYLPGLIGLPGIGVRIPDPDTGHYEYGYGNNDGNRFGLEWDDGEAFTFIESGGDRYYRKPRSEWIDPLDGTGPSGIALELRKGHILRMPFGWYGYLSVVWTIAVPGEGGDRLVVVDISGGREDAVNIEQPDLPIFAEADGGILAVGGRQYGVYGRYAPKERVTSSRNVNKSVGSTFEPVVTYRVKDDTRWRGVPVLVSGVSMLSTENTEWALIVGATLTGASFGSFDGIPPDETALEIDTAATAYSGGVRIYSNNIPSGQGNRPAADADAIPEINLPRELPVTLVARRIGTGSTTVNAILRAKEEW